MPDFVGFVTAHQAPVMGIMYFISGDWDACFNFMVAKYGAGFLTSRDPYRQVRYAVVDDIGLKIAKTMTYDEVAAYMELNYA